MTASRPRNLVAIRSEELSANNYVRKADPTTDYWFDYSCKKMAEYVEHSKQFRRPFNIILWGDENRESDFWIVPYAALRHVLTDEFASTDSKRAKRWEGQVRQNEFRLARCPNAVNIARYYGDAAQLSNGRNDPLSEIENDYAIENCRRVIEARQQQSLFRQKVLSAFATSCAVTGITEPALLVAGHIIPWAKRKETRLDPANGLCLSPLLDKLFEGGYFTLTDNLIVKVASTKTSKGLATILKSIDGKILAHPHESREQGERRRRHLRFHRRNIFRG